MAPSCFDLLDRHVVAGHADDVALTHETTTWTYARLLEEVAAFGGVLRHCGVAPGDQVGITLDPGPRLVVAVLAAGRVGARHTFGAEGAVVVGDVVTVAEEEYDWDVLMRAGRTDPAPVDEGTEVSPYDERTRTLLGPLESGGTVSL